MMCRRNRWPDRVTIDPKAYEPCRCFGRGRPCFSCATAGDAPEPPAIELEDGHAPLPGPVYWDQRCLRCSEPLSWHPSWWRRLRIRRARRREARRG